MYGLYLSLTMPKKSKLDLLAQQIYGEGFTLGELRELEAIVGGLVDAARDREVTDRLVEGAGESDRDRQPSSGARGTIELKLIPRPSKNGGVKRYGPYAYLRYYRPGQKSLGSKYLGKAQSKDEASGPAAQVAESLGLDRSPRKI